jgi:hypothetical protein
MLTYLRVGHTCLTHQSLLGCVSLYGWAPVCTQHKIPLTIAPSLLECPCMTSSVLYFVLFVHCMMSLVINMYNV